MGIEPTSGILLSVYALGRLYYQDLFNNKENFSRMLLYITMNIGKIHCVCPKNFELSNEKMFYIFHTSY